MANPEDHLDLISHGFGDLASSVQGTLGSLARSRLNKFLGSVYMGSALLYATYVFIFVFRPDGDERVAHELNKIPAVLIETCRYDL